MFRNTPVFSPISEGVICFIAKQITPGIFRAFARGKEKTASWLQFIIRLHQSEQYYFTTKKGGNQAHDENGKLKNKAGCGKIKGIRDIYKANRPYNLPRRNSFQRDEQGNDGRKNHKAYSQRIGRQRGGDKLMRKNRIFSKGALQRRPFCVMMILLQMSGLPGRSNP